MSKAWGLPTYQSAFVHADATRRMTRNGRTHALKLDPDVRSMLGDADRSRIERAMLPPHQIARADVAGFLRGSAINHTTFHASWMPENIRSIIDGGVDLARGRDGRLGLGFYTAPKPMAAYGPSVVEVAVRLDRPLMGQSGRVRGEVDRLTWQRFGDALNRLPTDGGTRMLAEMRRTALVEAGYDGVVPVWLGELQEVAALHPDSVRVVMPQGTQDAARGATSIWRRILGFG